MLVDKHIPTPSTTKSASLNPNHPICILSRSTFYDLAFLGLRIQLLASVEITSEVLFLFVH